MIYFNKTIKHRGGQSKILYDNPSKLFKIGDCLNNYGNGNTATLILNHISEASPTNLD